MTCAYSDAYSFEITFSTPNNKGIQLKKTIRFQTQKRKIGNNNKKSHWKEKKVQSHQSP